MNSKDNYTFLVVQPTLARHDWVHNYEKNFCQQNQQR